MPKDIADIADTEARFNEDKPFSKNAANISRRPSRHVMVTRQYGAPDVTRMIADAYQIVDDQLGHFRGQSSHEKFDIRHATVLHKLVCTLKILEDAESKRIQGLQLNSLSKESLDLLALQASKFADNEE